MSENILASIFSSDFLHFFVRDMFLCLDPLSLHACRQVNTQWNIFILREVWGKPEGRKQMEIKLINRFKMGSPKIMKMDMGTSLFCCQMDQNGLAVAASNGGFLKIAKQQSMKEDTNVTWNKLNCSNGLGVNFDMNDRLIVAGSHRGKVKVWNRDDMDDIDGSLIYESSSQGLGFGGRFIAGVKVLEKNFISATSEGLIIMYTYKDGNIQEKIIKCPSIGSINHIDADDNHVLFATKNGLRFADMEMGERITLNPIHLDPSNFIHHCTLFYPYATYSLKKGGFKLANVATGKIMRHLHDGVTVGVVAMNKRVVVVQDPSKDCDIFIYDRRQLISDAVQDKDLWFRRIQIQEQTDGNFYNRYNYVLDVNETSIVHFSNSESSIVIQDFWLAT